MRILLVDDDSFLRDMYATKFSQEGHDIVVARNGEEGEELFRNEGPFDVVLLDMIMPGISGLELIERVTADEAAKDTKIVVLSNQGDHNDIQKAKDAGAIGYIIKAEAIPSEVVDRVIEYAEQ